VISSNNQAEKGKGYYRGKNKELHAVKRAGGKTWPITRQLAGRRPSALCRKGPVVAPEGGKKRVGVHIASKKKRGDIYPGRWSLHASFKGKKKKKIERKIVAIEKGAA